MIFLICHKREVMKRFTSLGFLLLVGLWLAGCATGEPRLQGTWKSRKAPMPVEMVKVTTMQTVKVGKGKRKTTKQVPKTVTVAKTKSAPPYIDLILKYQGARVTIELPPENGSRPLRHTLSYEVVTSDNTSVTIDVREPTTGTIKRIQIFFDGPNRYWVNPAGGQGWKEYYDRIEKR